MGQNAPLITSKIAALPRWTLFFVLLSLLIFWLPSLENILIYDRSAIIHGEYWRLLTGNLVHFSASHLTYNLFAWLIAGTIIELRGYRLFPLLIFFSGCLIGLTLFYFESGLEIYAGLSGMVTAAISWLCLKGLGEKGRWRWLCLFVLTVLSLKILMEFTADTFIIMHDQPFFPVPLSHLSGMLASVLLYMAELCIQRFFILLVDSSR